MAGQSANCSVKEIVGRIRAIETNQQPSKGSNSGAETNQQVGATNRMQKKSC